MSSCPWSWFLRLKPWVVMTGLSGQGIYVLTELCNGGSSILCKEVRQIRYWGSILNLGGIRSRRIYAIGERGTWSQELGFRPCDYLWLVYWGNCLNFWSLWQRYELKSFLPIAFPLGCARVQTLELSEILSTGAQPWWSCCYFTVLIARAFSSDF
jgi:hypothetical protein